MGQRGSGRSQAVIPVRDHAVLWNERIPLHSFWRGILFPDALSVWRQVPA